MPDLIRHPGLVLVRIVLTLTSAYGVWKTLA